MIPRVLLFNHRTNLLGHDSLLAQNVRATIRKHADWSVVFDTDDSCIDKIDGLLHAPEAVAWYRDVRTLGKHRSDLCRLAQLYLTGGLYVDNDLEVATSLWKHVSTKQVTTVLSVDAHNIFQALLAAVPGHWLVWKSLQLFLEVIRRERVVQGWIGPTILYEAIGPNRSLVHLLRESTRLLPGRKTTDACEYAVEDDNGTLVAFSRSMTWGNHDSFKTSCYLRPSPPPWPPTGTRAS